MKIGILGGGQLGRMLALAGYPLGFNFRFFDPSPEAPARDVGELVVADWDDRAAIERFTEGLDLVTYEFENVPAPLAHRIAAELPVFPPVDALEVAQDRLCEKAAFASIGLATPAYAPVASESDLAAAIDRIGTPCILKTRRAGYDGKGQAVIRDPRNAHSAWMDLVGGATRAELVLEAFVDFDREVSALGVRARDGATAVYPITRNVHSGGILRTSLAPDDDAAIASLASDGARRMLAHLNYVGVLAIEFFVVKNSAGAPALLANEMAPRVHNSGHWTIEGATTSQFENHLRAIAGLPLGDAAMSGPSVHAAMVNLIGTTGELSNLAAIPGAHTHLYAKKPRAGRKVGHVTVVGPDISELTRLTRLIARVGAQPLDTLPPAR